MCIATPYMEAHLLPALASLHKNEAELKQSVKVQHEQVAKQLEFKERELQEMTRLKISMCKGWLVNAAMLYRMV